MSLPVEIRPTIDSTTIAFELLGGCVPLFFGSKIATLGRTSTGMAGYQFFVVTKLFILIGVLKIKRFVAFLCSNLVLRPPSHSNAIKVQ